jgi:serine protease Do
LVSSVTPGGPAAKAGIQDGDVVVKFDGKDVTSMRGLPRLVAQTQIGKEVDVEVLRKGQRKTFRVAVGRLTEQEDTPKPATKEGGRSKRGKDGKQGSARPNSSLIGLVLGPLTDDLRTKHGIDKNVKGVMVLEVDPDSPSAQKGVKAGDVIVEVAQEPVASIDDISKSVDKVRQAGRNAVLLRLEDGKGDMRFVAVPVQ